MNDTVIGSKNYIPVELEKVFECSTCGGIPDTPEGYIPYVKRASRRRYLRDCDEWFVRWDSNTVKFYHIDKKARFQNSSFYFKTGVGIPMVKSRNIRAFLMEKRVFDQSIVGIFPKDNKLLLYILALMNSDIINNLIHLINPTANNSANYVKQLPFIEPVEQELKKINTMVTEIITYLRDGNNREADLVHKELNNIIFHLYS